MISKTPEESQLANRAWADYVALFPCTYDAEEFEAQCLSIDPAFIPAHVRACAITKNPDQQYWLWLIEQASIPA